MARFNPFPSLYESAVNFAVGSSPSSVTIGDLNGDGSLDLITANTDSNNVSVLLGNGRGGLGAVTNFVVGTFGIRPRSVSTGDFNSDGVLDLVTANSNSADVSVVLGDGNGRFSGATNFAVGTGPLSVITGDFNGDNWLDLATTNLVAGTVSVLLGNGNGGLSAATNFVLESSPRSITTGDFNGDGILDLVTAGIASAGNVSVLLGDGRGGFGAATNFAAGNEPRSIAAGDFNRDGRLDVAIADSSANGVLVLLGDGAGRFGAATRFSADSAPFSVATGDLNGDGILDLATANLGSANVSVLLGNGSGGLGGPINFAAAPGARSVVMGDLNEDGLLDLVTANETANNISVLINRTPQIILDTVTQTIDGSAETSAALTVDLTLGTIQLNRTPSISRIFPGYQNAIGTSANDTLTGNTSANQLKGGLGNDILNGRGGNDTLEGDRGSDTLIGGAGNDNLFGSFGADTYLFNTDLALGDDLIGDEFGINTLDFSSTTTQAIALDLSLTDTQIVNSNLTLTLGNSIIRNAIAGGGSDTLTGNALANTLRGGLRADVVSGGDGDDILSGGNGGDVLTGGNGNDTLTGGVGFDQFVFNSGTVFVLPEIGIDTLTDFTTGTDKIVLSKTTFTRLSSAVGAGLSVPSEFAIVNSDASAETSSALIVYNSTNGKLFYNRNGSVADLSSDGRAGGQFATLLGNPVISASDFIVQV